MFVKFDNNNQEFCKRVAQSPQTSSSPAQLANMSMPQIIWPQTHW